MNPDEHAEAYRQAEASLRLSGLDPCGSAPYEALKAKVIGGEITAEEAHASTLAHFRALAVRPLR